MNHSNRRVVEYVEAPFHPSDRLDCEKDIHVLFLDVRAVQKFAKEQDVLADHASLVRESNSHGDSGLVRGEIENLQLRPDYWSQSAKEKVFNLVMVHRQDLKIVPEIVLSVEGLMRRPHGL